MRAWKNFGDVHLGNSRNMCVARPDTHSLTDRVFSSGQALPWEGISNRTDPTLQISFSLTSIFLSRLINIFKETLLSIPTSSYTTSFSHPYPSSSPTSIPDHSSTMKFSTALIIMAATLTPALAAPNPRLQLVNQPEEASMMQGDTIDLNIHISTLACAAESGEPFILES